MITVPQIVEKKVLASPFLVEAIAEDLINLSSLARKFRPDIEKELQKDVEVGSIIMALKRLAPKLKVKSDSLELKKLIKDITVRSNLIDYTFANSASITAKQQKLLSVIDEDSEIFVNFSHSTNETTLIISASIEDKVDYIFQGEEQLVKLRDLSSITLKQFKQTTDVPGVYYAILKLLAWNNINLTEVVSTYTELTIVLHDSVIDQAFRLIKEALK